MEFYLVRKYYCSRDFNGCTESVDIRVFHKLDETGNIANIGIRGFTT